jgi:hypothetical protein
MIDTVRQLLEDFKKSLGGGHTTRPDDAVSALVWGLSLLNPADFAPEVRAEFMTLSASVKRWADGRMTGGSKTLLSSYADRLAAALSRHGPMSQGPSRRFPWLSDKDLRWVVERDYVELSKLLMPAGAWKSAVVLAGSVTEAILVDLLTKDSGRVELAKKSPAARNGSGALIPEAKWRLNHLIAIATDIGLIPERRAQTFDQVLRDYRNFVHPLKEIRSQHQCAEAEAFMAKGALDALCNHLDDKLGRDEST